MPSLYEYRTVRRTQPAWHPHEVQRFVSSEASSLYALEPQGAPSVTISKHNVEELRGAPPVTVSKPELVDEMPVADQPGASGYTEVMLTKQSPGPARIMVHQFNNDAYGQKVLRKPPPNGMGVPYGLVRDPWAVHNSGFRDGPILLGGVTGDRSRPIDPILPATKMGNPHARRGAPSLVVTGPAVEELVACSLPRQRQLWAWVKSSERSRPLVAYAVGLLLEPAEALSRTPLELLWSLHHGGLGALGGPVGLSEQVAGMTGTIGKAISSTSASGLELMGTNPMVALIGGEICGALGRALVAPLVAHLVGAAQLIEAFSLILPHGDPRTLVSLEAAKGWTDKVVVHGLSDHVEPFAAEVAAAAALGLSLLATGRDKSSLNTRPRVDVGSGIELAHNLQGLDRQPSMAASTFEKQAAQMKRDMLDYDPIDRLDLRGKTTVVGDLRQRDAFSYHRVGLYSSADELDTLETTLIDSSPKPRSTTQLLFGDGPADRLDRFQSPTPMDASPRSITQRVLGDGPVSRLDTFEKTIRHDDALRGRIRKNSKLSKVSGLYER